MIRQLFQSLHQLLVFLNNFPHFYYWTRHTRIIIFCLIYGYICPVMTLRLISVIIRCVVFSLFRLLKFCAESTENRKSSQLDAPDGKQTKKTCPMSSHTFAICWMDLIVLSLSLYITGKSNSYKEYPIYALISIAWSWMVTLIRKRAETAGCHWPLLFFCTTHNYLRLEILNRAQFTTALKSFFYYFGKSAILKLF